MVNSYGLMVVAIKVTGREESSMEKVFMSPVRAMKNMENGKTGRESVGLERKAENNEIDFYKEIFRKLHRLYNTFVIHIYIIL